MYVKTEVLISFLELVLLNLNTCVLSAISRLLTVFFSVVSLVILEFFTQSNYGFSLTNSLFNFQGPLLLLSCFAFAFRSQQRESYYTQPISICQVLFKNFLKIFWSFLTLNRRLKCIGFRSKLASHWLWFLRLKFSAELLLYTLFSICQALF